MPSIAVIRPRFAALAPWCAHPRTRAYKSAGKRLPVTPMRDDELRRGLPKATSGLNEGARWAIVTLFIPLAGVVWNRVQKYEADRQLERAKLSIERQRESDRRRADSELVVKLLPALVADPDSPSRGVALAVLNDLANNGVRAKVW